MSEASPRFPTLALRCCYAAVKGKRAALFPIENPVELRSQEPSRGWTTSTLQKIQLRTATEAQANDSQQRLKLLTLNSSTPSGVHVKNITSPEAVEAGWVTPNSILSKVVSNKTFRSKHVKALGAFRNAGGLTDVFLLTTSGEVFVLSNTSGNTFIDNLMELECFPLRWPLAAAPCVEKICCGLSHYGLMTSSGELWMGGSNAFGQLGIPTLETLESSTPSLLELPNAARVLQMACGETHTVVVTDMNVVYEFGNGRSYPVVIEMSHLELPYGYKVVQLAAGNHLSVAAIEGTHDASGPYVVIWGNALQQKDLEYAVTQKSATSQFLDISNWTREGMKHILSIVAHHQSIFLHLGLSNNVRSLEHATSASASPTTTLIVWGKTPGDENLDERAREWPDLQKLRESVAKLIPSKKDSDALELAENLQLSNLSSLGCFMKTDSRFASLFDDRFLETNENVTTYDVNLEVLSVSAANNTLIVFLVVAFFPKSNLSLKTNPRRLVPKLCLTAQQQNRSLEQVSIDLDAQVQPETTSSAVDKFWSRWGKDLYKDSASTRCEEKMEQLEAAVLKSPSNQPKLYNNSYYSGVQVSSGRVKDMHGVTKSQFSALPYQAADVKESLRTPTKASATAFLSPSVLTEDASHPPLINRKIVSRSVGVPSAVALESARLHHQQQQRDVTPRLPPPVLSSNNTVSSHPKVSDFVHPATEKSSPSRLTALWKTVSALANPNVSTESTTAAHGQVKNFVSSKNQKDYISLPRIMGEEWDASTLAEWKAVSKAFEAFRSYAVQFWETYIFEQQFGVPKQDIFAGLRELRKMYMKFRKDFKAVLQPSDAERFMLPFERSLQRNLFHINRMRQKKGSSLNGRRFSVMRHVLLQRWEHPEMFPLTDFQSDRSDVTSCSQFDTTSLDNKPVARNRLKQLRSEVYKEIMQHVGCLKDPTVVLRVDEVPYQPWEIDASELMRVSSIAATTASLLPVTTQRGKHLACGIYRGTPVALKVTDVSNASDATLRVRVELREKAEQHFSSFPSPLVIASQRRLREIFLHSLLRHPNIITFLGGVIRGPQVILVLEWAHRGNLFELLHESAFELNERDKIRLSTHIVAALDYLHRSGPLLHRDIKSANVLITGGDDKGRGLTAKLSDFEYARYLPQGTSRNSQHSLSTRRYLLRSLGVTVKTQDVFSKNRTHSTLFQQLSTLKTSQSSREIPSTPILNKQAPSDVATSKNVSQHVVNYSLSAKSDTAEANDALHPKEELLTVEKNVGYLTLRVGSLQWMAPEMASTHEGLPKYCAASLQRPASSLSSASKVAQEAVVGSYSEKIDVFSFGVVLWEMCHRTPPYLGVEPDKLIQYITRGTLQMPFDRNCTPASAIALITACLRLDPAARPDMSTVLEGLHIWSQIVEIESTASTADMLDAARDIVTDLFAHVGQDTERQK